jgi:hypothetical protein
MNSPVVPEISFLFFLFSRAMAVESARERNAEKIFYGLASLSVENQSFDRRDSLMVLVLLYHSATKIGADADSLFRRVAAISTPVTSEGFLQFLERTPENRAVSKFGYKEGADTEGRFTYTAK